MNELSVGNDGDGVHRNAEPSGDFRKSPIKRSHGLLEIRGDKVIHSLRKNPDISSVSEATDDLLEIHEVIIVFSAFADRYHPEQPDNEIRDRKPAKEIGGYPGNGRVQGVGDEKGIQVEAVVRHENKGTLPRRVLPSLYLDPHAKGNDEAH